MIYKIIISCALLFFARCSVIDEEAFVRSIQGTYSLTETGVQYIKREFSILPVTDISTGTELTARGNGTINIDLGGIPAVSQDIAEFVKLKSENKAIFRLTGGKFTSMRVEGVLLIARTNKGVSTPEDVLFENLVPIAVKTGD